MTVDTPAPDAYDVPTQINTSAGKTFGTARTQVEGKSFKPLKVTQNDLFFVQYHDNTIQYFTWAQSIVSYNFSYFLELIYRIYTQ